MGNLTPRYKCNLESRMQAFELFMKGVKRLENSRSASLEAELGRVDAEPLTCVTRTPGRGSKRAATV